MDHRVTCCFSGYRPEKIPAWTAAGPNVPSMLQTKLEKAIVRAFQDGYRLFVTGMSRGFDLWAAQAVLQQREHLPIRLLCAIPFDGQANSWESSWKTCYQKVLLQADFVHSLAQFYTPDCFYARDHFMVNGSMVYPAARLSPTDMPKNAAWRSSIWPTGNSVCFRR